MQVQSKTYSRAALSQLRKQVTRIVEHNCVPSAKSLATLEEPAQKHEFVYMEFVFSAILYSVSSH